MISQCNFPSLPEPYAQALYEAVSFIFTRVEPVGIIASGSILRGNPDPASDLDIYVIHLQPYCQRIQKYFNGVPAEIFINPPQQIDRYLAEEQAEFRPITAHMLATGFSILEIDPVVEALRQRALQSLAHPPAPSAERLLFMRYMAANLLEDAADLAGRDEVSANIFLSRAVLESMQFYFIASQRYVPRGKDLLPALEALDPGLGSLVRQFYLTGHCPTRLALAYQIADRTIQAYGFLEWEGKPEKIGDA